MSTWVDLAIAPHPLPRSLGHDGSSAVPSPVTLEQQLRQQLRNPLLRTLAIVEIELLPHGEAFWAADARRIAVVSLAPGLCGEETAARLTLAARAELDRACAAIYGTEAVRLVRRPVGGTVVLDGLVGFGQLVATLGLVPLLPTSPLLVGLVVALGVAVTRLGYALAARP